MDSVFYFNSIQAGFNITLESCRRSGLELSMGRNALLSPKWSIKDAIPDVLLLPPGRFPQPTGL